MENSVPDNVTTKQPEPQRPDCSFDFGDDTGFIELKFPGHEPVLVDPYTELNEIVDRSASDEDWDYMRCTREHLQEKHGIVVGSNIAGACYLRLKEAWKDLQKKTETSLGLPSTTPVSTPSNSIADSEQPS